MEKIIHFTIPSKATEAQMHAIELAKSKHPDWRVMVWQDPVAPDDMLLGKYYGRARSGAQLADLIRLDVVYRHGGVYMDSDFEIVRALDALAVLDHFVCSEDGRSLTNVCFGAREGHPIIKCLIDKLLSEEPDWGLPPNETTGPMLFARMLRWWPGLNVLPRDTFYPYNWNEAERPPLVTTYGVHRWAASWKDKSHSQVPVVPSKTSMTWPVEQAHRLARRFISAIVSEVDEVVRAAPRAYPYGADLIVRTTRGFKMSLPGKDLSLTPEIALDGTYEESELKFVESILRGGDVFVDVGCNVGIFTIVAARRVGPFGRVHSIDANGQVLEHLQRSLVMNWIHDRVVVHQLAVGATAGEISFTIAEARLGDSNVGTGDRQVFDRTALSVGGTHTIVVPQVRLDALFPMHTEIKLVKIDVEGAEAGVIEGAERLFEERSIAYVMMELLEEIAPDDYRRNLAAVRKVLNKGYELRALAGDGSTRSASSIEAALRRSRNLVLVRTEGDN